MFAYSLDNLTFSSYNFKTKYDAIMEAIKQHALKSGVTVYVKEHMGVVSQFLTTPNQVKVIEKEDLKAKFVGFEIGKNKGSG